MEDSLPSDSAFKYQADDYFADMYCNSEAGCFPSTIAKMNYFYLWLQRKYWKPTTVMIKKQQLASPQLHIVAVLYSHNSVINMAGLVKISSLLLRSLFDIIREKIYSKISWEHELIFKFKLSRKLNKQLFLKIVIASVATSAAISATWN